MTITSSKHYISLVTKTEAETETVVIKNIAIYDFGMSLDKTLKKLCDTDSVAIIITPVHVDFIPRPHQHGFDQMGSVIRRIQERQRAC